MINVGKAHEQYELLSKTTLGRGDICENLNSRMQLHKFASVNTLSPFSNEYNILSMNRIRSKWGCSSSSDWCNMQLGPQTEYIGAYRGFMMPSRGVPVRTFSITKNNVGFIWWLTKVGFDLILKTIYTLMFWYN